jgi:hypothetical protein
MVGSSRGGLDGGRVLLRKFWKLRVQRRTWGGEAKVSHDDWCSKRCRGAGAASLGRNVSGGPTAGAASEKVWGSPGSWVASKR